MTEEAHRVRTELHRLLLDEGSGVAPSLVPRMLADPDSLTPEIRWCLLYLIRGIGCLAGRTGLLGSAGQDGLLDTLVNDFEAARRWTERGDWLWYTVMREDPKHWIQRYEDIQVRYSLDEVYWLNDQLGKLWEVERERIALEEPPLAPLARRREQQMREMMDSLPWLLARESQPGDNREHDHN